MNAEESLTKSVSVWHRISKSISIPYVIGSIFASQLGVIEIEQKISWASQPIMITGLGIHYVQPDMSDVNAYQNHLFSLQWRFILVNFVVVLLLITLGLSSALFPKTIGQFLRWKHSYNIFPLLSGLLIGVISFLYVFFFS